MVKTYLDPGHGGSDPGAVGYIVERDANLVEALSAKAYLERHGISIKMSRDSNNENTDINAIAKEANNWGADYVVSMHNNAGGGDGFEIYHTLAGGNGKTLAANIEAEVKKIGQNSRGLKTKANSSGTDYYGIIRLTNAPAVICEGVFVDNATDVKIADTIAEQQEFGRAYARGVLKTAGISDNGNVPISENDAEAAEKLELDGLWGKDTTKCTQKVLGTTIDGIVSGQSTGVRYRCINMFSSSWQFNNGNGSEMIRAIQQLVGAKVDGYCGEETIKKMQTFLKKLGYYTGKIDGLAGWKTVDGWQRYVNSKL